jgi:hypothetical protein
MASRITRRVDRWRPLGVVIISTAWIARIVAESCGRNLHLRVPYTPVFSGALHALILDCAVRRTHTRSTTRYYQVGAVWDHAWITGVCFWKTQFESSTVSLADRSRRAPEAATDRTRPEGACCERQLLDRLSAESSKSALNKCPLDVTGSGPKGASCH